MTQAIDLRVTRIERGAIFVLVFGTDDGKTARGRAPQRRWQQATSQSVRLELREMTRKVLKRFEVVDREKIIYERQRDLKSARERFESG